MSFHIEQVARHGGPFGRYEYRIYRDGRLIAYYWHDHKGNDYGIEFVNGKSDQPLWRMTD